VQKILKVRKRDGRIVDFDQNKITEAIWKAAQSVGGTDRKLSESLSGKVVDYLAEKFVGKLLSVEDVQDAVEKVLVENGHYKTAKAYILYREQHKKIRESKDFLIDTRTLVNGYLDRVDWKVRENANVPFSFAGLLWHGLGTIMEYYALNYVYPIEIAEAHKDGDIHLHNLSMSLTGYCAGWSLRQLLLEGFGGPFGKVASGPPHHLSSALGQLVNFNGTLQNEWAGAQAFSSFDTYMAPYVRKDKLDYKQVKQAIQEFVFCSNISSRWGSQVPFTNLTLDWNVPNDLKNQPVIIGKEQYGTYDDYQKEMDIINKAFIEVLTAGDAKGRVFAFPIPTYNITKDFNWNSDNTHSLFEMTAKYGLPYFQNFIKSDLNPDDVRAMCCHLSLDLRELRKKTGGLFGFGESTGSVGVVTINLPRIGFLSKDETEFFERLDKAMYVAMQSLELKRKFVTRNIETGLLEYTKRYLGNLDHHFSTIGLIGMNEACLNFLGESIATDNSKSFAIKVLKFMRERLIEYQKTTGNIYNLEATPAEGTSYRFALLDKKKYPAIKTAGEKVPYYTNSTHLPVNFTDDLFAALKHQEDLQRLYTGGTVFHAFLGEALNNGVETAALVKKLISTFAIPYVTITPTFSICPNHGYVSGEHFTCPTCNSNCEVYSRIVGYLRPVQLWHDGKQEEFKQRLEYKV